MVEDGNARLLDLLIQKYERKRWHCEPTNDMHMEARKANMSTAACRQSETSQSPQAVSSLSNFVLSKLEKVYIKAFQLSLFGYFDEIFVS